MDASVVIDKLTQYVALVLALCVHEFAHAASARSLGDHTAEDEGRLTLSPLSHADLFGTVIFPLIGLFGNVPLFGWARPVPVQPANFRRGWFTRGQILVAGAGPGSNLLQALFWLVPFGLLYRVAPVDGAGATVASLALGFMAASVQINLILAAFNILPVPPLDGSHVASAALPREMGAKYDELVHRAGLLLLVVLILPIFNGRSVVGLLLQPVLRVGHAALRLAAGIG